MAENRTELEQAITNEIAALSPLLVESQSLKEKADKILITDKITAKQAKTAKRELVAHRTRVIDLRKSYTRDLDHLKSQLVAKQDEILKPSIEGEAILIARITEWDDEQERIKAAELKRIQGIIDKLSAPKLDRKTVSEEDVIRAQAALKMEQGLIDQKDRNKKAIKTHFNEQMDSLKETLEFVHQRDLQAAEAKRLADERAELEQKERDFEAKKATPIGNLAPGNATNESAHTGTSAPEEEAAKTSGDPVADVAAGMDATARAIYHASEEPESIYSMVNDLGQEAMDEALKMLERRLSGVEGTALGEEAQHLWMVETIEELYQIIANYQ
jgi:hypothetical protein